MKRATWACKLVAARGRENLLLLSGSEERVLDRFLNGPLRAKFVSFDDHVFASDPSKRAASTSAQLWLTHEIKLVARIHVAGDSSSSAFPAQP